MSYDRRERFWEDVRSRIALRRPPPPAGSWMESGPTLFLLDDLLDLSRHLDADPPIRVLDVGKDAAPSCPTIESMAAHHVELIRAVQPVGPYYLGGQCARGVLAFEVAQQLHARGERVAFLALLDTKFPEPAKRFRFLRHYGTRAAHHLRAMGGLGLRAWPGYTLSRMRSLSSAVAGKLAQSCGIERPTYWHQTIIARRAYTPRPFPGRLTLFLASDPPVDPSRDRRLRWVPLAEGGADVFRVPGDHYRMIREPCVRALAAHLDRCLREARSSADSLPSDHRRSRDSGGSLGLDRAGVNSSTDG